MSNKTVAIIDYHLGNLFSVKNACEKVGLETNITSSPEEIMKADAAILPGVGAFGDAMKNINTLGLSEVIKEFIQTGKPFMGICLGLQLLFSKSEEFGEYDGLGVVKGLVKKFPNLSDSGAKIRVPQIGWNSVKKNLSISEESWSDTPLKDVSDGDFMYFVHSYYVVPEDKDLVLTTTNYEGINYCSSIRYKNVVATQFHPEKSANDGVNIYKNWAENLNQ